MKILWLDLGDLSGYTVMKNRNVIDYGEFTIKQKLSGHSLAVLEEKVINLIVKYKPDMVGVEDIFSQSTKGYKRLAKLQGIVEKVVYEYNGTEVFMAMAKSIRKDYQLNIQPYMTYKQFRKKQKAKKKNRFQSMTYKQYMRNPKFYINDKRFKHIDFSRYTKYVVQSSGEITHISKAPIKQYKNGNRRILGHLICEFDYAKKIVVVDYINQILNTNFKFKHNNTTDAILGCLYMQNKLTN